MSVAYDLLTLQEAAAILGISLRGVRDHLERGNLQGVRKEGDKRLTWLVVRASLDAYIQRQQEAERARAPRLASDGSIAVTLSTGAIAHLDPEDSDLAVLKWAQLKNGYATRNHKGTMVYLHQIIAKRIYGSMPDGSYVDHADRNRLNNRRNNIRIANASQSTVNRSTAKGALSGYRGVYYMSSEKCRRTKPWLAQIGVGRKTIYLGYFASPEQAARAYNNAALRYYGEFAELNEIPE